MRVLTPIIGCITLLLLFMIAGCGGGGGSDTPPTLTLTASSPNVRLITSTDQIKPKVTLTWTASPGARLVSSNFGATSASDTMEVGVANTKFFTLTVANGSAQKTKTVGVVADIENPDIVAGSSIGQYALGQTYADIRSKFSGIEPFIDKVEYPGSAFWDTEGIAISVNDIAPAIGESANGVPDDAELVDYVGVYVPFSDPQHPEYELAEIYLGLTAKGIGLGCTRDAVRLAYGTPKPADIKTDEDSYPELGLDVFYAEDSSWTVVEQIVVTAPVRPSESPAMTKVNALGVKTLKRFPHRSRK